MTTTTYQPCRECLGECVIFNDQGHCARCSECHGSGHTHCEYCQAPVTPAEVARPANPALRSDGIMCDACARVDERFASEAAWHRWHWLALPPAQFQVRS